MFSTPRGWLLVEWNQYRKSRWASWLKRRKQPENRSRMNLSLSSKLFIINNL